MNVCFIAAKHMTHYFADVSRRLERKGHRVFWLSPSTRWTRWLMADGGVSRERIMNLPDFASEWKDAGARPRPSDVEELSVLEEADGLTIAHVTLMCRSLRERPPGVAYAYLAALRRHMETFLRDSQIDVCFGEATWGFEILTWMMCRQKRIRCVFPTTVRIPDDRFAFFDSYPHEILEIASPTESDQIWAKEFLEKWTNRPTRPIFSRLIASPFVFKSHWWTELAAGTLRAHEDQNDLTLWPLHARTFFRLRVAFNRIGIMGNLFQDSRIDQRFVLFPLHQQPEAAVDVLGAFNSNQAHFIEQISRILPATHQLWVKEHKDALGARSRAWFDQIARLPNVRLIDPEESTFDLIRRADLLVTITGTSAYEASLLGTPSATAGSVFFSKIATLSGSLYRSPLNWPLREILQTPPTKDVMRSNALEFLAWLHAQSFPGTPFDRVTVPNSARGDADIDAEAEAFDTFLQWPDLRPAA